MKQIMICIDFGPETDSVVNYAADLALDIKASIHLVFANNDLSSKASHVSNTEISSVKTNELVHFGDKLEKYENIFKQKGIKSSSHILLGDISTKLTEEAKSVDAYMIIIGSKKTSAVQHLVGGSIGASLLKETGIPLLLVP